MGVFVSWLVRFTSLLALAAGVVLLIVDSPLSVCLPFAVNEKYAEAAPLLLVGAAYLAWLLVDRPAPMQVFKHVSIAAAFLFWGIDLLIPAGRCSRLLGAIVIAIYVFDLALLMEWNLRQRRSVVRAKQENSAAAATSAAMCWCGATCQLSDERGAAGRPCCPTIAS